MFESLVIKRYQWCSSRGDAAFIFIVSFSTGEATKKMQIVLYFKDKIASFKNDEVKPLTSFVGFLLV